MGGEDAGQIWVRKYLCLLDKVEGGYVWREQKKEGQ